MAEPRLSFGVGVDRFESGSRWSSQDDGENLLLMGSRVRTAIMKQSIKDESFFVFVCDF